MLQAIGTPPQMPATMGVRPWAWANQVQEVLLKPAQALRQRVPRVGPLLVTAKQALRRQAGVPKHLSLAWDEACAGAA